MPEEKQSIVFEAKNVQTFTKGVKDASKALSEQAKALDTSARELRQQIIEAKKADAPNKQLIKNLALEAQQAKLSAAALRAQTLALKEQAAATSRAAKEQRKLAEETKGGGSASVLAKALNLVVVAATAMSVGLVHAANDYNTLQARIKNATDATGDYMGVSKELNRISKETGTTLEANVDLFQRLKISAEAVGASNKDILRFTESVAKLGVIGGQSQAKIADSTLQLAQMFAQPRVEAEELNSVLDGMPEVAARIEKGLGLLPGQLKSAVKEGKVLSKDVLQAILKQSKDIDKEFAKFPKNLGAAAQTASNSFNEFAAALDDALGITPALTTALQFLGGVFAGLTKDIKANAQSIKLFRLEAERTLVLAGLQSLNPDGGLSNQSFSGLGAAPGNFKPISKKSKQQLIDEANKKYDAQRQAILSGKDSSFVSDKKGPGYTAPAKSKKGKSQASIERDRISAVERDFQNRIGTEKANASLDIERLGPYPNQEAVLVRQFESEAEAAGILQAKLAKLKDTAVKTAEGKQALSEAIEKTNVDIIENEAAVTKATNALKKFVGDEKFQDFKRNQEIELQTAEDARNSDISGIEEARAYEEQKYQERIISINEYYDHLDKSIDAELEAEKAASDKRIELLKAEIKERKRLNDAAGVKDLESQIKLEDLKNQATADKLKSQKDKNDNERKQALQGAAKEFGDTLENSISNAIIDAFDGDGPLKAVVNFARSLKSQIVSFLAQGLAEGFKKSAIFQEISAYFGNLFNAFSKRVGPGAAQPVGPVFSMPTNLGLPSGSSGANATFAASATKTTGLGSLGAIAASAAVPLAIAGYSAANAAKSKGSLGMKYLRFIDPLGFRKLFGIDKGPSRQEQRAKYQQEVLQPYLDNLVNNADPNNLEDLRTRAIAASRGMKANGSNGMRAKAAAQQQIKDLIAAREKSIKEAIETLTQQNQELTDSIRLADAKPFERAKIEREIALRQIESDTKKLLDQFKDSQEAQTKILEQEALKRQQLNQQEQQAAKANVQDLQDLLAERDEIANSNVFTRAKSASKIKAERLSAVDQQIAELFLELQGQLAAGITPANTAGLNQILASLNQLGGVTNKIEIIVNEANDPNAVREEITRALDAWTRKVYGTNVA